MTKAREYIIRRVEHRNPRINGVIHAQSIYHEIGRVVAGSRATANATAAAQFPGQELDLIRVDENKQAQHSV